MALDAQRNWTVSMAENLQQVRGKSKHNTNDGVPDPKTDGLPLSVEQIVWSTEAIYLPDEIIVQILEYIAHSSQAQQTLASCCVLSHQWYSAAVPLLYKQPFLYGKNFDPFVRTICPSKNLHVRKSLLAGLVRVLNMGSLVHQGGRSVTARLLGRTKDNLETFVAPTATFAENSFPALSRCQNLNHLDLSLVSESPSLSALFKATAHLEKLLTFRLPRSSGFAGGVDPSTLVWPPNLENLGLSGGIDAHFLHGVVTFPITLRSLTIEHCPLARGSSIMQLFRNAVRRLPRLESLKLNNLPRLNPSALDNVLYVLPGLRKLSISVDYITPAIFDFDVGQHEQEISVLESELFKDPSDISPLHTQPSARKCLLRTLELTNSGGSGIEDKITPIDVLIGMDEGALQNLRQVRVVKSLLWDSGPTKEDAAALSDALQESAARRREAGIGVNDDDDGETGVWTFDDR